MREYYRLMLGSGNKRAAECFAGGFVGTDYEIDEDLTGHLPEKWQEFNRKYIPVFQAAVPSKSKISAGLSMGALWTVSKGMQRGDILLCLDGTGRYRVAEVAGDYVYEPAGPLPHRRPVRWLDVVIDVAAMSDALRASAQSRGTVPNLSKHREEIERLIGGVAVAAPAIVVEASERVEDAVAFAMESHLEDFLIENWAQTELGREFTIYEEDGERVGQQYPTDTGPLDILAVSKDKKKLLVVELKRGRASDVVVGQTLRYMGYVQAELAEEHQTVEGVIVALEDDQRIRRALSVVRGITFYRYEVSFKLVRG